MLCLPALTPVANDAHAVGDSGECVVLERRTPLPRAASFFMFGSLPSSIHFWTRRGSMPSKPRMTSFCWNFCGGAARPARGDGARDRRRARASRMRFTSVREKKLYHWEFDCASGELVNGEGRVLAVDVGARRVGLAISDASRHAGAAARDDRRHERRRRRRAGRATHRAARRRGRWARDDRRRNAVAPRRHAEHAQTAHVRGVHRAR